MTKNTQNLTAKERISKKARLDTPPATKISPRAGSPHPRRKHQAPVQTSEPTISFKGKEKEQPVQSESHEKRKNREENVSLPTSFKVVAGSYEKLLYGLDGTVSLDENSNLQCQMKPIFIFPAHVSCIKAVAASVHGGKWLATGSSDEIIKVWDLRRKKEIGGLMHHEGSITDLIFPSRSHLISASEDGTLCLFRARDWTVLRSLKGHNGRVNSIAVHPSGKVALSVGKDRALRMWDLMRGKGVASTKIGKEGEIVRWSVDGSTFVVQSASSMDVYDTKMEILHTITHPSRIHDLKFCRRLDGGEFLLVAAEDHKLSIYNITKDSKPLIIAEMIGHTNRVKAVQTLEIALPKASGRSSTTIICTVSSDGFINLYDLASIPNSSTEPPSCKSIEPLTSYDSNGTRLTCVTLADGDAGNISRTVGEKRKASEVGDGDEVGSEDNYVGEDNIPFTFGSEDENREQEQDNEEIEGEDES